MKRFPKLELLIGIAACVLIWLLGYPQYREKVTMSKLYHVKVNAYTLRAAIEKYAAYNEGNFPVKVEEFGEFFTPLVNPYTNKPVTGSEIKVFQYDSRGESKEQSPTSENGRLRGAPGTLAYGVFIGPGDEYPSAYGIVGFGQDNTPIAEKLPSGEVKLFVLHE